MSDLSRLQECREWLADWRAYAEEGHGPYVLRRTERVLAEQTANCNAAASRRGESSVADYRKSLAAISSALVGLRAIAARQEIEQAKKEAEAQAAQEAYLAEIRKKYPHPPRLY